MEKEIKTYEISFDETEFESGIDMIAITDNPAIQEYAMRFNKEVKNNLKFSVDKEKRIIAGVAMIPNKEILRYDEINDRYFNVVFSKETIEKMVEKFNSELRDKKFNYNHDESQIIGGFIKGSWIVEDSKKDKSNFYGFELPEGSWFIEAKITDDEVWEDVIKKMDKVGFSIEGFMYPKGYEFKNINNKTINMSKKKFNAKHTSTKEVFNKETAKFETVKKEVSEVLIATGLEVGTEVFTFNVEDLKLVNANDGVYTTDNATINIFEGKVASFEDIQSDEDEEKERMETEAKEEEARLEAEKAKEDEEKEKLEDEGAEGSEGSEEEEAEVNEMEVLVARIATLESRLEDLEKKVQDDDSEDFEDKEKEEKKEMYSNIFLLQNI